MEKQPLLIDYHLRIQSEANREALRKTCMLLKFENGNPYGYATGVFLQIENAHYMITAAHVVDNHVDEIFIGYENSFKKLGGELITNSLPDGLSRNKDNLDIAILKLDDESIAFVEKKFEFLQDVDIEIDHKQIHAPVYSVIGYPATKNKFNRVTKSLKSNPFIFTTEPANNETYTQLNHDISINVIVNYKKNRVYKNRSKNCVTGPDPFGISGSGLWFLPCQIHPSERRRNYLIGILHTWPIRNRNFLVATRIDVYLEIIKNQFTQGTRFLQSDSHSLK